jgi:hypothetical protein
LKRYEWPRYPPDFVDAPIPPDAIARLSAAELDAVERAAHYLRYWEGWDEAAAVGEAVRRVDEQPRR